MEKHVTNDLSDTDSKELPTVDASLTPYTEEELKANPFLDPKIAKHYVELYASVDYECRHVFDPALEWTPAEEKRVLRKVDWHVCTWACVMFFAMNIDRKNLGQAISDNMLDDLSMSTNQYNYAVTIFLVSFLLAELPSQLISKKLGPDRWIPAQMMLWSVVAAAQAAVTNVQTFYLCRVLLGLLTGGFIPDLVLWLSYFYTSGELPIRLSFFWVALDVSVVAIAFMAYGLLHMDGLCGLAGWRWLFLIEGLLTLLIGFAAFFLMPASAVETKKWFRPNGWFNDREVGILVNKVLRDDPSKGDMHNRMAITPKRLWKACADYDLWPLYLIGLLAFVPMNPPGTYLTLSLRHLGFNPVRYNSQLNLVRDDPSNASAVQHEPFDDTLRGNKHLHVARHYLVWALPCIIALRFWSGSQVNSWGTFSLITVLLSYPYAHAVIVAWASRNSGSVRTRSVSAALYNITVQESVSILRDIDHAVCNTHTDSSQLGNVISANVYRADDAPLYHRGNDVLLALCVVSILLFLGTKQYYKWRNAVHARQWNAMSQDEQQAYLDDPPHEGNKRLDFQFAH